MFDNLQSCKLDSTQKQDEYDRQHKRHLDGMRSSEALLSPKKLRRFQFVKHEKYSSRV
jgi:hypothetical protein